MRLMQGTSHRHRRYRSTPASDINGDSRTVTVTVAVAVAVAVASDCASASAVASARMDARRFTPGPRKPRRGMEGSARATRGSRTGMCASSASAQGCAVDEPPECLAESEGRMPVDRGFRGAFLFAYFLFAHHKEKVGRAPKAIESRCSQVAKQEQAACRRRAKALVRTPRRKRMSRAASARKSFA